MADAAKRSFYMAKEEFNQFVVIGLGRFGSAVARTLSEMGKEVLAIDIHAQNAGELSERVTQSVVADTTDKHVLKSLGISDFDVVIVAIGTDIQASILTTLLCKEMGVKKVVAKAQNEQHKKVLEKIGADLVIQPEASSGIKLATMLASPNIIELAAIAPDIAIVEIKVPAVWVGKSLVELGLRQKHSINLLLVRHGDDVVTQPTADYVFDENDHAVVCGHKKDLAKLSKIVD